MTRVKILGSAPGRINRSLVTVKRLYRYIQYPLTGALDSMIIDECTHDPSSELLGNQVANMGSNCERTK